MLLLFLSFVLAILLPFASPASTTAMLRPAPVPAAAATEPQATMIAVGDVMLSREVGRKLSKADTPNYPFSKIDDYLQSADFVFGNLESPIADGGQVGPYSMQFCAGPGVETILHDHHFAVMSVANNHIHDMGEKGVISTVTLLEAAGVEASGAGKDIDAANAPVYFAKNGLTFAFLSYVDPGIAPKGVRPNAEHAGAAVMNIERMQAAVNQAKTRADIVIVSMHGGIEYTDMPTKTQQNFAHAAIDAGATVVVGAHPHVIQPVEQYHEHYILYSLGNFVFDQVWSNDTRQGMTAKMHFTRDGLDSIEFIPVYIGSDYEPSLSDEKTKVAVQKRLEAMNWRAE